MINRNKNKINKNRWNYQEVETSFWLQKVKSGDRFYLSKAISLVESTHQSDLKRIQEFATALNIQRNSSKTLAITGPPGVGKSTLINALGLAMVHVGNKVAVLSIDPSDPDYGGSVLGDKTRMGELALEKDAFIRPSPAGSQLGGMSTGSRLAVKLCAHAGFDFVLLETVGVGQSEIYARHMSDLFILLHQPGAGDDLQGIKKGIVQIADMILITKADGDLEITAKQSKQALKMAQNYRQWNSVDTIQTVSALDSTSVSHVLEVINRLYKEKIESGTLEEEQVRSRKFWIDQYFKDTLVKEVRSIDKIHDKLKNELESEGNTDELVFVHQFIQKNIIEKLIR